jgi:opacity protein-like surface antigen
MMFKRLGFVLFAVILLLPAKAFADITAFLGVTPTPTNRVTRGFSGGVGLLIVAFEFEYANTVEDELKNAPNLKTFMVNGLVQTPFPIGGMQFYGTAGGGGYRESFTGLTRTLSETNVGTNFGGGVKINVLGPLRLRLDYRVFRLQGEPQHSNVHRLYAGANLKF